MQPPQPGLSFKERMRALGKAVAMATPERRAQAVSALSFQLHALTHEAMRKRVARLNAEIYRHAASAMAPSFDKKERPMPPEQLVKVLHALSDGLTFLRFLTPELITDDVVIAACEALAQRRGRASGDVGVGGDESRSAEQSGRLRAKTEARMTPRRCDVSAIFENLEAGANIDDILAWYDGLDRGQVKAVIEFAARSLDTPVASR